MAPDTCPYRKVLLAEEQPIRAHVVAVQLMSTCALNHPQAFLTVSKQTHFEDDSLWESARWIAQRRTW